MPRVSRDPDEPAPVTIETIRTAEKLNLQMAHVNCYGDGQALAFIALTAFVPQQGNRIMLDGGKVCEVENVVYRTVVQEGCVCLVANVMAKLVPS